MHTAESQDTFAVTLVLSGSYGSRIYTATATDGTATFSIPAGDTEQRGYVTATALVGARQVRSDFTILPGRAVAPITPLVGARSIVADGAHWAMATVIPHDNFGNPVLDGTLVDMTFRHPGAWTETETVPVRHLLAWARIWSGTVAGRTLVVASVDGQRGPEAELLEIPGWPVPFSVAVDRENVPADGRQLVTLRTTPLQDAFGNILLDGTAVTFVVRGLDGAGNGTGLEPTVRFIPAYTLNGVAEAPLEAPAEPLRLEVTGTVFNIESAPLTLSFGPGPAAYDFPVTTRVDFAAGFVSITAGPLLGQLNQFTPDGTPVTFRIQGPNSTDRTIIGAAASGEATIRVRLATLAAGAYAVQVSAGTGQGLGRFEVGEARE